MTNNDIITLKELHETKVSKRNERNKQLKDTIINKLNSHITKAYEEGKEILVINVAVDTKTYSTNTTNNWIVSREDFAFFGRYMDEVLKRGGYNYETLNTVAYKKYTIQLY